MKDHATIVKAIRQDHNAGADMHVAEYRDSLYSVALGLCDNAAEAEDLVFRTFEQVVAKIDSYREGDAFFGWMATILRNYYLMSQRGNVAKNTIPLGGLDELADVAEVVSAESVGEALDGNVLRKMVDDLPPKLREVVVLHYFMDQPIRKVAKMLSLAKGTVKSRLYYARLVLGKRLSQASKRPVAILVFALLFVAAAVSAVSHAIFAPPMVAEVDEPVFLDDAPVESSDDEAECWHIVPAQVYIAKAEVRAVSARHEASRSVKTAAVPGFQSSVKSVCSKPIHAFSSIPNGGKVIISR